MTTIMHGHLMKNFLDFMAADWEYEYGAQDYDPHEMMNYFLGQHFTESGTFVPDPYGKKQYYIQNYNNPYEEDYDEGYDSWG